MWKGSVHHPQPDAEGQERHASLSSQWSIYTSPAGTHVPCISTGTLGSNKDTDVSPWKPYNTVHAVDPVSLPTQCWDTEWQPVIGMRQLWSPLSSRLARGHRPSRWSGHVGGARWAVPGSRAPPATPRRALCCSSCSAGEGRRPGTGSETASGCGAPCPRTESPGSGSPRCSSWSTVCGERSARPSVPGPRRGHSTGQSRLQSPEG